MPLSVWLGFPASSDWLIAVVCLCSLVVCLIRLIFANVAKLVSILLGEATGRRSLGDEGGSIELPGRGELNY